jgi:aryl-phospho-beta-D-glucosidase BglC (GH1 family)
MDTSWGFNWVRLPMDYRFWTDPNDLLEIDDKKVEPIDRAIKLGQKHVVQVNISLHRAPGEYILDGMDEKITSIHITNAGDGDALDELLAARA